MLRDYWKNKNNSNSKRTMTTRAAGNYVGNTR